MVAFEPTPADDARRCACWPRCSATPTRRCARTCPRCATLLRDERALAAARLAELDALIDALARADPLDAEADYVELFDRGRAHLAAPVRARARRLARPRPGDDRPRRRPTRRPACSSAEASCPTTCRWCSSSSRPSRRARRAAFLGEMAHILNAIFGALQQRDSRVRQRARRAARAGRREGAGRCTLPAERAARRELGRAGRASTAARPRARRGPASRSRSTSSARPSHPQPGAHRMNTLSRLPVPGLSVRLPRGVPDGQPDPLRPRPVHAGRATRRRCCAPARCAGAATCSTSASCSCSSATWSGCSRRTASTSTFMSAGTKQMLAVVAGGVAGVVCFVGLSHAAAPAHLRSAHPPDQPPHRHRDPGRSCGCSWSSA